MAKSKPEGGCKKIDTKSEKDTSINKSIEGMIGISRKFAQLNKLITRDLNNSKNSPSFSLFTKDDITNFLSNPAKNQDKLREAVTYIYGASSHFRRLIQYFAGLTDFSYVVSPYLIDPNNANKNTINRNYRKVLSAISSMNVKTQFPKILTVCLREDTFYGTMWVTKDNITIQQLPSEHCSISTIEGNVPNVSFDFSYFDRNKDLLEYYPKEFTEKYNIYKRSKKLKWIELDSPTSFAVKCNNDILNYSIPPFVGILREVYDIEDYKQLKLTKTELENYAMLVMTLPMDDNGEWVLDYDKAKAFWRNLDSVLPDEVGSVLSPMKIDKINFEHSTPSDANTISDAEQNLFTAAGVSSLLFNNDKASANALVLSIKADQAITFGIVKSIEDVVNRFLQSQSYGKNFKVTFLDVSPYNRKEAGDAYLKACQYGIPLVSYYCASQGLSQSEMDCMNYLENDILNIKSNFIPLKSSATQSSADKEPGRPESEDTELTESGERTREDGSDWG